MTDHVQRWFDSLRAKRGYVLTTTISVSGAIDKHTGPAWQRASGHIVVTPSTGFEIADRAELAARHHGTGYFEHFVFGLLDVILLASRVPLENMKVTVTELIEDKVYSSQAAFRLAGRD